MIVGSPSSQRRRREGAAGASRDAARRLGARSPAAASSPATRTSDSAIGFVPKSLNQEYWVNTEKGAEAGAQGRAREGADQGGRRRTLEIVEQIDLVENLLAQDVDALVIAPSDSDLLKPVLEKAAQARSRSCCSTPTSPTGSPRPPTSAPRTRTAASRRASTSPSMLKDGGTLAIISGIPGSQVGIERVDGVKAGPQEGGRARSKIVKEITGQLRPRAGGRRDGGHPPDQPRRRRRLLPPTTRWRSARSRRSPPARRPTQIMLDRLRRRARGDAEDPRAATCTRPIAQDPYGMAKVGVETALDEARRTSRVKKTGRHRREADHARTTRRSTSRRCARSWVGRGAAGTSPPSGPDAVDD